MIYKFDEWTILNENVNTVECTLNDIWREYNQIKYGDRDIRLTNNTIKQVQLRMEDILKKRGLSKWMIDNKFKIDGDWGETSIKALSKVLGIKFNNIKSVNIGPNVLSKLGFKRPVEYSAFIKTMATTLAIEAGSNASINEIRAIANIIANRKVAREMKSYIDVVMEPSQFSLWNGFNGDVKSAMKQWRPENKENWNDAVAVAKRMASGELRDNTKGATHYYNPTVVVPAWGKGTKWKDHNLGLIHRFGRDTSTVWAARPVIRN